MPEPTAVPEQLDELLTPEEFSALTKIPEDTLQDWRTDRTGPPFLKLGRAVRYRRADVRAWLEARVVTPAGAAA